MAATGAVARDLAGSLREFVRDIKLEHSVFALPFAVLTAFLVSGGWPPPLGLGLIVVAMVTARPAGMGINRLADARIDARNPRTARRALASGRAKPLVYLAAVAASLVIFVVAAAFLERPALWLSPVPVAVVVAYPYLKRFTWLCHFGVGALFLIVPPATEIALSGGLGWGSVLLGLGAMVWVAGFDVLYGIADQQFDRDNGLHSFAARFGIAPAIWMARGLHLASVALLAGAGPLWGAHWVYYSGVTLVAILLAYENSIVRVDDLSKLNTAFFTMNGVIAVVFGVAACAAALLS